MIVIHNTFIRRPKVCNVNVNFILSVIFTFFYILNANPRISGFIENSTAIFQDHDYTWTDVASARLEGSWDYRNRGGLELHSIASASLRPLDPFMYMDDSSVTKRLVTDAINNYTSSLIGNQDTSSSIWRDINGLMTQLAQPTTGTSDIEKFIRHLPYSSFYPRNSVIIDRAMIKLFFKHYDLYIGRQMIGWGVGYAWNPTDIWNKKNPTDPNAPKVGINAMRMEISFSNACGLSVVLSPGTSLDQTSGGARFKTTILNFDLSLSLIRSYTADAALLGLPERVILGGDFAGQIGNIGIFAEAALVNPMTKKKKLNDIEQLYVQSDIGCQYTFGNGLYFIAEYYYNQLGAEDRKDYNLSHLLYLMNGDMAGLGRHYGFLNVNKDILRFWTIQFSALANIGDHSVLLLPTIDYNHSDNITIKFGGSFSIGNVQKTEFGGIHNCGTLVVSGYF